MKEKTIVGIVIVFLSLLAIVFFFGSRGIGAPEIPSHIQVTSVPVKQSGAKDTTYSIDGQPVTLSGGVSEQQVAPDSATKIKTSVFGELTLGDVNGDGQNDAALILTQDGGGSGTFYYLAVAYSSSTGIVGTNALLLGDRVAPQTLEIKNGMVIANYATRKPDEPMSTAPSVGVSLYAAMRGGVLTDITKEMRSKKVVE